MRLVVATNWDDALLQQLEGLPVQYLFAQKTHDLVGGGRPSHVLPTATDDQMARHVRGIHSRGWKFLYLLNATQVDDREYDAAYVAALQRHVDWVRELGADGVVVGMAWMVPLVKRRQPGLEVVISTLADVDSPRMVQYYEGLGADTVILSEFVSRDFRAMRRIRQATGCDIEVLTNNRCIYQCPFRLSHAVSPPWHSRADGHDVAIEHELFFCASALAHDRAEVIRSRWIRPEDLAAYEDIGIDRFKIAGRNSSTAWLARATRAYAQRSYPGMLGDIVSLSQRQTYRVAARLATTAATPELRAGWQSYAEHLAPIMELDVDNTKLPADFIKYFQTHDCTQMDCRTCGYCDAVAAQAVVGGECDGRAAPPPAELLPSLELPGVTGRQPA